MTIRHYSVLFVLLDYTHISISHPYSNSVSITYSFQWQQHHQTVSRTCKDRFSVRTAPEHLPLADPEPVRLTSLSASCKDRFVDRTGTLKAGSPATLVYSRGTKQSYMCWNNELTSYHTDIYVRFLRPWIIHNNNQAKTYCQITVNCLLR